ncbi:OmpA family protein [Methylocaldum sp.]|uniref:OmpA family protein n=1 Tax=Methylocaldum sp. TaxID=1969727 RepID=UPI002D62B21B|nr:OmpA family protein [Methylocaldum sp.]HYE34522.1 OmpA family protein [Methylocaldum sp.]
MLVQSGSTPIDDAPPAEATLAVIGPDRAAGVFHESESADADSVHRTHNYRTRANSARSLRVDLGAFMDKKLPNGVTLHIPANGVENKLLAFIEDKSKQVSPNTWFSFDRVEFDTDASTLKPLSQQQLRNIAEIMKAYPQVTMRFSGYTDNTGNPERNLQLSRERANSAMNQVVALGIDSSRLAAEGYGEQHPIADNATAEGRQRNRRVDINVSAK